MSDYHCISNFTHFLMVCLTGLAMGQCFEAVSALNFNWGATQSKNSSCDESGFGDRSAKPNRELVRCNFPNFRMLRRLRISKRLPSRRDAQSASLSSSLSNIIDSLTLALSLPFYLAHRDGSTLRNVDRWRHWAWTYFNISRLIRPLPITFHFGSVCRLKK